MNSKIKAFRTKLHGVNDTKFFIFRLCKLYMPDTAILLCP